MLVHLLIGTILYALVPVSPYNFAAKALFPAASILVGMAVAWTARAAAILQDARFRDQVISDDNPIEAYVYGYQLSLFIIIVMVVFVTVSANGGLRTPLPPKFAEASTGIIMYSLLSLALRECWNVINFSNLLAILHSKVPSKKNRTK